MSDIIKYGNSTLTESFGDSPEAQQYAKLPILNEELILENLKPLEPQKKTLIYSCIVLFQCFCYFLFFFLWSKISNLYFYIIL